MTTALENFFIVNSNFCRTIGIIQENLRKDMVKFSMPMLRKVIIAQPLNQKNIEIARYAFCFYNPNLAQ